MSDDKFIQSENLIIQEFSATNGEYIKIGVPTEVSKRKIASVPEFRITVYKTSTIVKLIQQYDVLHKDINDEFREVYGELIEKAEAKFLEFMDEQDEQDEQDE